jgi:hypothetical protein
MINKIVSVCLSLLCLQSVALGADPAPATLSCTVAADTRYCETQKKSFLTAWPAANAGDYMAQRTVSFCLLYGCKGAVAIDLPKACTWSTLIVSTEKSGSSDAFNFHQACQTLTREQRTASTGAAMILFGNISKKLMTKPLPYEPPRQP